MMRKAVYHSFYAQCLRYIYAITLLFVASNTSVANSVIDSLQATLVNSTGTQRLNAHYELCRQYAVAGKLTDAQYHARQQLKLATRYNMYEQEADALYMLGVVDQLNGQPETAAHFHLQALEIRKSLNDVQGLFKSYNSIAVIFYKQKSYDHALHYYESALKLKVFQTDGEVLATVFKNTGILYRNKSQYTQALNCFEQAMALYDSLGDSKRLASLYNHIGLVYKMQEDYANAALYYTEAIALSKSIRSDKCHAYALNNLGRLYQLQAAYTSAIPYFEESLALKKANADAKGQVGTLYNLAKANYKLGKVNQSEELLLQAASMVKDTWLQEVAQIHKLLAYIYQERGNASLAASHNDLYIQANAKLAKLKAQRKYQTDSLRNSIDQVKVTFDQKQINSRKAHTGSFYSMLFILLTFLLAVTYYVLKRVKIQQPSSKSPLSQ